MANSLETIYRNGPLLNANTTPSTRNLPNGGGEYTLWTPNMNKPQVPTPVQAAPTAQSSPSPVRPERNKYINPATGDFFQTADEYGNYIANKIPKSKGRGDVPQYAGDALTRPDESSEGLIGRARGLNNARNDIAVGETDPYDITKGGSITYTPEQRRAIEKAYAGVYDPAINDVFERLKTREEEKKQAQDREDKIFATNESIRAWKATTGSKEDGTDGTKMFTRTQLNTGASNSGLSTEVFDALDNDIKNFYINPPKAYDEDDKVVPVYKNFEKALSDVKSGARTAQEVTALIMESNLPETVKHYFIAQMPLTVEEKKGYFSQLWSALKGE